MTTIHALGNQVLVGAVPKVKQSPGGILYHPTFIDDRKQWFVLAVGPGRLLKDGTRLLPDVRAGDRVVLEQLGKDRHPLDDGTGRVFVDAAEIVAIVSAE
jgi:chaperonin GroES